MLSHPLSDWIIEEQKTKTTPRHLALGMSQNASSDVIIPWCHGPMASTMPKHNLLRVQLMLEIASN
jgi:hypothetical protein